MDPLAFGATRVNDPGVPAGAFPSLNVAVWYDGASLVAPSLEQNVETDNATVRILPNEGGGATVAATSAGATQTRIVFDGAWDVVFIDAFDAGTLLFEPCSLVLEVYEEDEETIAWEVGTSPGHPFPYLVEPGNYGAQEIDVIAGAATIGQVEVTVVDKAQTAGDQDSGYLTERLVEGAVPAIRGRRCRLIRYVSDQVGFVVIADGPAGTPRLDDSFAAYRFVVKDVRETEREIRTFTRAGCWIAPIGHEEGFGKYEDDAGGDVYLVDPTDPLVAVYREVDFAGNNLPGGGSDAYQGLFVLEDYFPSGLDSSFFFRPSNGDSITGREIEMTEDIRDNALSEIEIIDLGEENGAGRRAWHTWPTLELLWRPEGSDGEWTVVNPAWLKFATGASYPSSPITRTSTVSTSTGIELHTYELPSGSRIEAISGTVQVRGPDVNSFVDSEFSGQLTEGNFPAIGDRVEFALRYVGEPTEELPLYVEFDDDGSRLTAGRLLQRLYDGFYSDRDETTGAIVPTGIRYDDEAILAMTDPVRLRLTEPVDDLRDWAEKKLFAPTGWAPSLDNALAISPSSQVIPASFDGYPVFDDDVVEPVPVWNAGETIVNFLSLSYPRWYDPGLLGDEQTPSIDNLRERTVEFQFRSVESLLRKAEKVEFEGEAFAAIGDSLGGQVVESEVGEGLALDRKLYIFDRYNTGAQTIEIPIRRTVSKTLRPGDWVVVSLSWLPDYILQRRGAVWGGQIVALHDVDCVWRVALIEEAVPLVTS